MEVCEVSAGPGHLQRHGVRVRRSTGGSQQNLVRFHLWPDRSVLPQSSLHGIVHLLSLGQIGGLEDAHEASFTARPLFHGGHEGVFDHSGGGCDADQDEHSDEQVAARMDRVFRLGDGQLTEVAA